MSQKTNKLSIPTSATDTQEWINLAFDEQDPNKLEKLSKDQLSVYVSHYNLPNGTKSSPKMMIVYIKMHLAANIEAVKNLFNGENIADFKIARIKKELAKMGVLPEGTYAELSMKLLEMDQLKQAIKQNNNNSGQNEQGQSNNNQQNSQTVIDGVSIAKEVLRRGEAGDYEGILSLLGTKISRNSTVGEMRKAYLKLSLLIHPDKLQQYPDAKKAFQELVDAFERLSKPENFEQKAASKSSAKNSTTLRRSNQGCHKTKIYCPRCKHEWGTNLDGNPEFAYTLLMTGLKNYHCSTCLLEFGCISAIHKCPFCKKGFEYHPDDFHRKVKCGNHGCDKEFGFYEDLILDRVMNEIKEQILHDLEIRMKRDEAKKRRAKSMAQRSQISDGERKKQEEQAYLIGLNDLCPRCGIDLHELDEDIDQYRHLRECTDEYKHKEYQQKKKAQQIQEIQKEEILNKQNQVQNEAAFNAFGGMSTMLWMLTEEQLKKQCQISNLDETGSKEEMIARLAKHRQGQKALGSGQDEVKVPKNLYGLSDSALRGVMLAQGLNPDKYRTKQEKINAIERIQIGLDKAPQMHMLTDDPNKENNKSKEGNKDDSEDDCEDKNISDSDYEQPDLEELEKRRLRKQEKEEKLKRKNKYKIYSTEEPQIKKKKKLTKFGANRDNSD